MKVLAKPGAIRVGSTGDIAARQSQYQHEGYSGTIYYARTENMRVAEDRLLQGKKPRHNEHRVSNSDEERGYT